MTEATPGGERSREGEGRAEEAPEDDLVVLRCDDCGDVFPHPALEEARCPSCGSGHHHVAGEPLL